MSDGRRSGRSAIHGDRGGHGRGLPLSRVGETAGRGLRSVFLAAGLTTFGPLPAFLLGGLAVLVRDEIGFSEARLGAAIAVFFAFAALGSVPAGWFAERIGARRALPLGLVTAAAALGAMALAHAWWHLAVALAVAGMGHAVLQVGSNLLLANDVPPGSQGLAFGIKQSAVPFATLIAGAAVPLVGTNLGWRAAYAGTAIAATLVVLGLAGHLRRGVRYPRSQPRVPAAPFSRRQLLILAVAVGFGAASANALAAFLVEYAVSTGMPVGRAGALLATSSLLGLTMRIAVGRWADMRRSTDLLGVALLLVAGGTAFAALPAVEGGSALLWLAAAVAFSCGWGWPGLFTFIVASTNSHAPAAATGVVQTGVFAAAVAGPLLFGLTVSSVSYTAAWSGAAACQFIGAALIISVRHFRRAGKQGESHI